MTETKFMSIPACARNSGVSKDFLYHLCKSGRIEFIKIGKKYMLNYPRLIEYLEAEARKGLTAE